MNDIKKAWSNSWKHITSIDSISRLYGVKNVIWCFNKLIKNEKIVKILDVGCGAGFYFNFFSKKGAKELHGLEYETMNVEKARSLNKHINVKIIQGDIKKILSYYQENYFDLIISLGLIEHFKYPINKIKDLIKLIKLNGILILEMPNFNNYFYYRSRLKKIHTMPFHNWWGVKEWYNYLSKIDGCHLEKIQTGDFWSDFGYLHWNLQRISSKLIDLEISIENRIFQKSGSLAFYKLRKIS